MSYSQLMLLLVNPQRGIIFGKLQQAGLERYRGGFRHIELYTVDIGE
jgi:hypothetical protein